MKKQTMAALALLLLIPIVTIIAGLLFSMINPEIAAGHPNYARNYHILNNVKLMSMWGSFAVVGILSLLVCYQVIRTKERSSWWMLLAVLGPFGFSILSMLDDRAPLETDRYVRFVRRLNIFVRIGYEACAFAFIWELAYQAMVIKRNLMIMFQSATSGVSVGQIIDIQNASSGMWAFGEGMEVMYLAVLLYLLRPILFNVADRVATTLAPSRAH